MPIDPAIVESSDDGKPFVYYQSKSEAALVFEKIVEKVLDVVESKTKEENSEKKMTQQSEGNVQRFAMPLANGMVSAHFGHAEKFMFIDWDMDNNVALKTEEKDPPPHEPGVLPRWIADEKANIMFTGGIGPAAQQILEQKGVQVVAGITGGKPLEVVEQYVNGQLESTNNTCDH